MVQNTVEKEAEQKNLHAQIQIPSLIKSWVEVWREQDRCDEKQVWRIRWWRSQSFRENPSEADLEHLRILQYYKFDKVESHEVEEEDRGLCFGLIKSCLEEWMDKKIWKKNKILNYRNPGRTVSFGKCKDKYFNMFSDIQWNKREKEKILYSL